MSQFFNSFYRWHVVPAFSYLKKRCLALDSVLSGGAYVILLIIFSFCVFMNFPSNYKCRASICSLFSQVTVGALLLGFLVSCDPSYLELAH